MFRQVRQPDNYTLVHD